MINIILFIRNNLNCNVNRGSAIIVHYIRAFLFENFFFFLAIPNQGSTYQPPQASRRSTVRVADNTWYSRFFFR